MNKNKQVGKGRSGPQESFDVEAGSKKNSMRAAGPARPKRAKGDPGELLFHPLNNLGNLFPGLVAR